MKSYKLIQYKTVLFGTIAAMLCLLRLQAFSQSFTAQLDRNKILLGEQIVLEIKIEDIPKQNYILKNWVQLPDSINHLFIVKKDIVDSIEVNGTLNLLQHITLTSFDSGKWALPLLNVSLHNVQTNKEIILTAFVDSIEVLPPDISHLTDYHDIKNIINVKATNNRFLSYIIYALIFLIVFALIWLFIKQTKRKTPSASTANIPAFEWANKRLDILEKEFSGNTLSNTEFYVQLNHIFREYIFKELHIPAMRLTTDELMIQLKLYLQKEEVRTAFFQACRLIDAVKFARYTSTKEQCQHTFTIIKQTIAFIHTQMQHIQKNYAY
jgi:hypothetical protein